MTVKEGDLPMDLVSKLVTNPIMLFVIGLFFFVMYALLRSRSAGDLNPRALLWPGLAWTLWAVWEFGIARFSPEANIRVDLFLIIPIVLIVSIVGIVRLFRSPNS